MTRLVRNIKSDERERCARLVEEIPTSASLYESAEISKAVTAFKKHAVTTIRELKD